MKGMRRIFSGLLALAMVIAMLPVGSLAEEETGENLPIATETDSEQSAGFEEQTPENGADSANEEPAFAVEAAQEGATVPVEEIQDVAVESVTIIQEDGLTELAVGEAMQLTAVILPEEAAGEKVTWSSSDETVATVDENGLVSGLTDGNVTISIKVDSVEVNYILTVDYKSINITNEIVNAPVQLATSFPDKTVEPANYTTGVSTTNELELRLNELINKYKNTYWTQSGSPCTTHGTTCNSRYYYAWQCKGFAGYIFNDLFCGGNIGAYDANMYYIPSPTNATLIEKAWNVGSSDTTTVKSILSKAMPGDYVQVRRRGKSYGHTMIVVSVTDAGINIFDCNSDGKCGIKTYFQDWATFAQKNIGLSLYHSTKYPSGTGGSSGGSTTPSTCSCSTSYAGTYTCTTSSANLTIRSGHGSSYGAVGSIPPGATVTVSKASGTGAGHWAHVTYNGVSGYASMEYLKKVQTTNTPTGVVDSVTGRVQQVVVRGWAFDKDDTKRAVGIHVYIGKTCIGTGVADQYRHDVNNVYGVGDYHGYEFVCNVPEGISGNQNITVYAIDAEGAGNPELGTKTVEVKRGSFDFVNCANNITVSGTHTFRFKQEGYGTCDVNLNLNGQGLGTIYPDSNGYFSYDLVTTNFPNGTYTLGAIVRCTDWSEKYVTRTIKIDNKQYTISYNANGGSGAPAAQTKTHGVTLKLSSTKPTRSLYNFKGWATTSNATTAAYPAGGSYTGNASVTLYAVWEHVCANGHNYSYKKTTGATTTSTGKLTGTCSRCSGTTSVTLPKLSTTDYTYKVVTAATCTANGTGRYTWKTTSYGTYYFDVTIGKTGHSYYYKLKTAPSIVSKGELTGICSRCSGTTSVSLPALNKTDYTYTVVKASDCETNGIGRYTWNTTTYGSYFFDVNLETGGHNYEAVVTHPTCTEGGYTTHTCSVCGDSYVDSETEALDHNWVWLGATQATCETDGETRYMCNRSSVTAGICGATRKEVIPATGHSKVLTIVVEPTCEEQGYTGFTCASCKKEIKEDFVDPTGHTEVIDEAVAPNCTDTGLTQGSHCSACGKVLTEQEVIPAGGGHSYVNYTCQYCGITQGSCGENVSWTLEDGILTISGTGKMRNYDLISTVIPDTAERVEKMNYCPWALFAGEFDTVVIEEGVTSVGDYAFYNYFSSITRVTLPSTLKSIGRCAFHSCSMTSIELPDGLEKLGYMAFGSCKELTGVALPDSVTTLDQYTFAHCEYLADVQLSANLSSIPAYAFMNCGRLAEIEIPDSVTSIGYSAFGGCHALESITIPQNVTKLGNKVFSVDGTKEVHFLGDAPTFSSETFKSMTVQVFYPAANTTWTEEVRQNYGGTVTWTAVCSGEHVYGDWQITRAATADSEGQEQRSCVCGDTQTRKLIPVALAAIVEPATVKEGAKPEDVKITLSASLSIGGAGITDLELEYVITDASGNQVTLEEALAAPGKYTITPKINTP